MNFYGGNYGGGYYRGGGGYSPQDYRADLMAARANEKKALGKNAAKLGGLLLIYNALNRVYLNLFYILSVLFLDGNLVLSVNGAKKILKEDYSDVINGSGFSMTGNLLIVSASAITIVIIAVCLMKIDISSMLKPYKGSFKQGIRWIPTCLTLNILIGIVVAIFVQYMSQSGVTVPEVDFSITSPSNYAVIVQFVYVCVIGPFVEELIYRGFIIKLLSPFGKGMAVFFSAFIFGIMHENIPQAASAFAGALIYAAVAVRYNSIAPTIVMHIANNLLASLTDIGTAAGWAGADRVYMAIQIVILFIGFYGIIVMIRPLTREVAQSEPACAMKKNERIAAVFTNGLMILYFIYILWQFIESFLAANA